MNIRSNKVDVLRGLLFALMVNSHALTLAHVPKSHWFWTDLWFPKGWATVVFVILSGYGVGLVYSMRPADVRAPRLQRRCLQLLAVMMVSNTVFAGLREYAAGRFGELLKGYWWFGLLTFETKWTISGVLMPTAMVMLCGAALIRWTEKSPWATLAFLVAVRGIVSALTLHLTHTPIENDWPVQFLLFKGFGGYPIAPFMINGCIGIWLGVMRRHHLHAWQAAMGVLLVLHLAFLLLFRMAPTASVMPMITTLTPLGRFACMFVVTHLFELYGPRFLIDAVEAIGRVALGSFVMHRVFIQLLGVLLGTYGMAAEAFEMRYFVLTCGTLFLTWFLSVLRQKVQVVDLTFTRMAL